MDISKIKAPELLSNLQGWLVWKYETPDKSRSKKPLKVPYYVTGGRRRGDNGTQEDRSKLTDFATALSYAKNNKFDGVGLALMPEFGITAIDFDNCVDDLTGDIDADVLQAVQNTYTEISPSGNGIRAFVKAQLGNHKSGTDTAKGQFGFELFDSKGYVTFTGNVLFNKDINAPSNKLEELIKSRWQRKEVQVKERAPHEQVDFDRLSNVLLHISADCSYSDWCAVGMAVHHETDGSEDGFILWDSWSANSAEKYSSEEYNRSKWDSFGRNANVKPTTFGTLHYLAGGSSAPVATAEDFTIIAPSETDTKKKPENGYFNIRSSEQFLQDVKSPEWLIKGLLPKAQLGILFGKPGSGKSFMTLDLCASLARGEDWNALRVTRKYKILYIVAEGAAGFSNRIRAYKKEHIPSELGIDIISDVAPNLLDKESVHHLIQDIEQHGPYDLVVMDTFAQVTPGSNENSGEDMGRALAYCKRISEITGALVLLVHHSGKDASKGARGWSGIFGAADVVLSITRDGDNRKMTVDKNKDGDDNNEFGFKLKKVLLGQDDYGDDITSCVVNYCAAVSELETVNKLSEMQQFIVNVVKEHDINGWITVNNLLEICMEMRELKEGEKACNVKSNIKRSILRSINVVFDENKNGEIKLIK